MTFQCLKQQKAAQRVFYWGCPNCGSTDIDLVNVLNDMEYLKTLVAD